MLFRPFKIGDKIALRSSGAEGWVKEVPSIITQLNPKPRAGSRRCHQSSLNSTQVV